MKSEKELNSDILAITMTIAEKYPELSKYISEQPVKAVDEHHEITLRNLKDYYDSLDALLKNYAQNHETPPDGGPQEIL